MRSLLRSLFLVTAMVLGGGTFAQLQYWAVVYGQVAGCTPGQVITVTTSYQTVTATVDPNCYFWASVYTAANPDTIVASTPCQGAIQTVTNYVTFNGVLDSALVNVNFNCGGGGGTPDCLGIPGGPNVPGTACNDNDPSTVNDTWTPSCVCVGTAPQNCQAAFSIASNTPWTFTATDQSTGVAPMTYQWWLPDGSASTLASPSFTFTSPGVYGICLTIAAGNGCTSVTCDTLMVDSVGGITVGGVLWDCLQIPNGPNMPGTPCTIPGTILQGTWSASCQCVANSTIDCLGIPGGTNLPGTPCADSLGGIFFTGVWDVNCSCVTNGLIDCLGQVNGPALPGTPCDDNNPATINDMWTSTCQCVGGSSAPCEANFWVLQAFTVDSLNGTTPIPYEVWVWNLSSGGSGSYSYLWSFGDGTSSTDPFPTHTYSGNGPYLLCLAIDDGAGCTSTYCDSVSIDANGLYTGMIGGGNDRQNGFTLNVQAPMTTGVQDVTVAGKVALWPNPVSDDLNVAVTDALAGTVEVTVLDMSGRVVLAERRSFSNGRNQLTLPTAQLAPGLYTLRMGNGTAATTQRFVKTR